MTKIKEDMPITELNLDKCTKSELIIMIHNQEAELHNMRKSLEHKENQIRNEIAIREKLKTNIANATLYICIMEMSGLKIDLTTLKNLMGSPVIDVKSVFEYLEDIK